MSTFIRSMPSINYMRQIAVRIWISSIAVAIALSLSSFASADGTEILVYDLTDEWIVDLHLRGRPILLESAFVYGDGSGTTLFVPLLQFTDSLGFVLDYNAADKTIEGWFLRETQHFSLDVAAKSDLRVTIAGRKEALSSTHLFQQDNDIYVPLQALSDWFKLGAVWDRATLRVTLSPPYLLPNEEIKFRKSNRALSVRSELNPFDLPLAPSKRKLLSWPHSSNRLAVTSLSSQVDSGIEIQASSLLQGEFLKLDGELFLTANTIGRNQSRLKLGRTDPEGGLLGPLRAQQLEFGDLTSVSRPLLNSSLNGVGLRISKQSGLRIGQSQSTVIAGSAFVGWGAELYRDNELLALQDVAANGRYQFDDVQLIFGENRFRVELFGPEGQRRTIQHDQQLDSNSVSQDNISYDLEVFDVNREFLTGRRNSFSSFTNSNEFNTFDNDATELKRLAQLSVGYGLTDKLALKSFAGWQEFRGLADQSFAGGGLTYQTDNFRSGLDILSNKSGDVAGFASFLTRIAGISIGAEAEQYSKGFITDANQFNQVALKSRRNIRLNKSYSLPYLNIPATSSAAFFQTQQINGNQNEAISFRQSARVGRASFGQSVNFQSNTFAAESNTKRVTANSSLVGPIGPVRFRGNITYNLESGFDPLNASVSANSRWRDWSMNGQINRNFRTKSYDFGAGVSRSFDGISLGLNASHNTQLNTTRITASLGFALDRDLIDGTPRFGRAARSDRGAIRAYGFMDRDENGEYSEGDDILTGRIVFSQPRGRQTVLEHGGVLIEGLPRQQLTTLTIDQDRLQDPFAVPLGDGKAVYARRGTVIDVYLPVIETGEVEISMLGENEDPLINKIAKLTPCQGGNAIRQRSAFDGFVFFQFLKPGCYQFESKGHPNVEFNLAAGGLVKITSEREITEEN